MERVVKCAKGDTSVWQCGYAIIVLASTSLFGAAFSIAQQFADKERGALRLVQKKLHILYLNGKMIGKQHPGQRECVRFTGNSFVTQYSVLNSLCT